MLVGVLGGGLVARDRAVDSALAALPASQRSFQVDAFGLPTGQSYRSSDLRVRHILAALTTRRPLAGTFFRQLEIGNGLVRLVSLDHLQGLVRLRSGRLPRECVPARCEVVQVGAGDRSAWRQDGINLVRVGVAVVPDAAVFGSWLEADSGTPGRRPTRLLASGADAFDRIPALEGFYRVYSWIDPVAPGGIHVWEIDGVLGRESRAQTALAAAGVEYQLSGPDGALLAAQATAGVAGQLLNLIGGEISALLLGFALVAAVGLRRGLAAERWRLLQRGASSAQVVVSVVAEIGATTVAGGLIGAFGGVAVVALVARKTGLPTGAVLDHGPGSPWGVASVILLLLFATAALVAVGVREPDSYGARKLRLVDVAALGAAAAAGIGFAGGGLDAGADATFLLLLPGLVCFAAAVGAARLLGPLMRAGERLTRGSPPAFRLAMLGLARAPAQTAATAAFLVVAVGLALFAAAYRATLEQGAADEAAFAVPLDFTLGEGASLVEPLDAAPLSRIERIAPGVLAYPVVRQTADVPGPGASFLNPTVLGLPPDALVRLHWRPDFAAVPLSTLAARIGADPQTSLRGLSLPPGASISLQARVSGAAVQLDLAAETESGDVILLPLGAQGSGRFTARTPAGSRLKLVGLEISLVSNEVTQLAHRAAEGTQGSIPSGSTVLGPLRSGSRMLAGWQGWVARGATLDAHGPVRVSYAFTTGQTVVVRRRQATDGRPLLVIASPSVAAAAGPGGRIAINVGSGSVPARVVGVATRFPGSGEPTQGFVIADESRLSVALDATMPGSGRATEVWLAVPATQSLEVGRALDKPPFAPLVAVSRSQLERVLAADPLARGVTLTLAAAALVAAAFAVLALWLALANELGDSRGELLDLEAQGVGPRTLRRQFRVRAAVLTSAALTGGGALGLLLSRLVLALVRISAAGTTPEPPLRFEPAWTLDAIGLALFVVAASVVVELTTRRALRGESPGRPSWSLE